MGGENADDSALNGGGGAVAGLGGDKSEIPPTGGDFAEKGQDVNDGAVVEGDRVMITALQRVDLRPAAGGKLRGEEVVEAALKGGAMAGGGGGGSAGLDDSGEVAKRCNRGVVVEDTDVAGFVTRALAGVARARGEVGVFIPAAGWRLKRKEVVGEAEGIGGREGIAGRFDWNDGALGAGGDERRSQTEGGELVGIEFFVGCESGGGTGEVIPSSGLIGGRESGDAFGGKWRAGGIGADHGPEERRRNRCKQDGDQAE